MTILFSDVNLAFFFFTVTLQRLLQPCKINLYRTGTALCDIRKHSTCIRNTCVCTKGYVANEHGQCELKDSYLVRMEMSEYRVKPGEYCRDSTNCIEGLVCEGFKCKCPTACTYDQRKEFCDCGDVEEQVGPIMIGVLLGLNIIFFWGYTIKRTIRKHKEMMKQFSSLPADDEYVPRSYALSPVHSSIQTETTVDGTASPASRIAGTSITEDTGTTATYSLHPPTLPNDPLNPESDKPPSYIDVISSSLHNPDPSSQPLTFVPNAPYPHAYIPLSCSTQQSSSPPHSLSGRPHSRSSSPAPDHGSPSVTTHPISPSAPPPPGSPNAVLQQDNSSAPVGAATSSSPSHSVPEAPPAYNPYFKEDSAPGTSD
ncbi:uncharacterized protein LOC134775351 isoform X2 [Penaeus indicus]|uniref:uncharacterized protein LOC134775351 isoform X2 n=1 Tax=Penaeus indicus TaxID=29960 RepID=UPI00300C4247